MAVLLASCALAQDTIGDVYASDASVRGSVVLAGGGTRVLSGSTVSAGGAAANLKLARGGAVRVCPGTNFTVASSQSGRALQMGLSTGALELHYDIASTADSLQTSDFRFLFAGPGTFHLAISADTLGNTCVRPMAHNTASVIVQELFGDATYQVKPEESLVFRKGKIAGLTHDVPPECGCPAAPPPVTRAEVQPPTSGAETQRREAATKPESSNVLKEPQHTSSGIVSPSPQPQTSPIAPAPLHVEADAPFIYHADPAIPEPPMVALVSISNRASVLALSPVVLPPPDTKVPAAADRSGADKPQKSHFFGRVRAFFATLFK